MLDRALRALVVTPRVHGIHHSQVKDETNSNYGVVFTFWDRIFRSWRCDVPQEAITIGVPGYDRDELNRIGPMLAAPFREQPTYWGEGELRRDASQASSE
jgi:sterol desaturase/sphingolipid hydroxylase (fatty acid hydroxylase superfamily)